MIFQKHLGFPDGLKHLGSKLLTARAWPEKEESQAQCFLACPPKYMIRGQQNVQIKCLGHKPDLLSPQSSKPKWLLERTYSMKLSSDFHLDFDLCTYTHSDNFLKAQRAASIPGLWTHSTNIKEKTFSFNFAHSCHLFFPTNFMLHLPEFSLKWIPYWNVYSSSSSIMFLRLCFFSHSSE